MKLVNTKSSMFRGHDVTTTVPSLSQIYGPEAKGSPGKIIRLFDKPLLQIFADAYSSVLGVKSGTAKGIASMKYVYTVKGTPSFISRIAQNVPSNTSLGRNFQPFTVCLNENSFFNNDIMYLQNRQQLQVVRGNGVELSAGKWQYTVILVGNNPEEVVDFNFLQANNTVSKLGNAQPELSREGYMSQRSNEESRVNYLRKMRVGRDWSGDAAMAKFAVCDTIDGKSTPVMWMTGLEKDMLEDLMLQKEMALLFGKANVDPETDRVFGLNGFSEETIMGDGVWEAIRKEGINEMYTVFTEGLLRDILGAVLQRNPMKAIGDVNIVMMTGFDGLAQFDSAMRNILKEYTITSDHIVTKKGDNIEIGANFTTYKYMGAKFTVVRNPIFDDVQLVADRLTPSGRPSRSSTFLVLDMSSYDGVPNIQLLTKEGCNLITGYQLGFGGKNGKTSGEYSTPVQGARMDMMTYAGVVVHVPETCMILEKSFI